MPHESKISMLQGVAEMLPRPKANYVEPRWAEDGMKVIIPFPTQEKPRQGLWCRVAVAAGNHARVVNEARGVDRWFPLYDLRVPVGDPHA